MNILLNYNFLRDGNALDPNPSSQAPINYTKLTNGIFTHWNITNDVTSEYSSDVPTAWDYLTVMDANFNNTLDAGNISAGLDGVVGIKVKRRKTTEFDWQTVYVISLDDLEDWHFTFNDYLCQGNQEYEYALVPFSQDDIEGNYASNTISTKFDGVFICDTDTIYRFYAGVEYGTQERVHKVGVFEPYGRQYPVVVSNGVLNYDTGSFKGTILNPEFETSKELDRDSMREIRGELLDFLTNKRAKVMKDWDGNIWLLLITGNPTVDFANNWGMGLADVSANWSQVGDANNADDLYANGLVPMDIGIANVTLGTTLSYTGYEQTQTITSVICDGLHLVQDVDYTITGNTGTEAGVYTMTLTGLGIYRGTKNVTWSILAHATDLAISKTAIELLATGDTDTFAITSSSDGAITVTSDDVNVATATLSGRTVTVEAVSSGSATITVTQAATSTYAGSSVTCSVTAGAPSAYLTFTSSSAFTIAARNNTATWNGTMYYTTDDSQWNVWDASSAITSGAISGTQTIKLCGAGNTTLNSTQAETAVLTFTGSNISCSGNIETLLDYATVARSGHPTMGNYAFASLFRGATALIVAPTMSATTLSDYCYYMMYKGSGITTIPTLPATTLAAHCYALMFEGCTGLTTISSTALPATTLANYCYDEMFDLCTNLTTAPNLPATTLAEGCYFEMFLGCSALTSPPASLPALTLARACYYCMFKDCTALTTPPHMAATTLADWVYLNGEYRGCCEKMYMNCTALTVPCKLYAKKMTSGCYYMMFYGRHWSIRTASSTTYGWFWRVPWSGTGVTTGATNWNTQMLDTDYFTDPLYAPTINTTYYLATEPT